MYSKTEFIEDLKDCGCGRKDMDEILSAYQSQDKKAVKKMIAACRQRQLDQLHKSQQCIDRLDYLSYQLENHGI